VSLGNVLKEAREAKGLSLDSVEGEIRIRKKYLVALESDDYQVLPGQVYTRAFLRTYSRFLGLDVDALVTEFDKYNPRRASEAVTGSPLASVNGRKKPGYLGFLFVAGVIILLVAFNSLYGLLRGEEPVPKVPPPGANVEESREVSPDDPEPDLRPDEDPLPPPAGLDLVLQVTGGPCWMRVVVDGEEVFRNIASDGESLRFQGRETIDLTLGNAGVVEVQLNGESLGVLGQFGEVVRHEFAVES
jgi:transcriptional regulator with XRE-family HTH domain